MEYLRAQAIEDNNLDELKKIIDEVPKPENKSNLGDKLGGWIGKMVGKAASGTWKVAPNVAAGLLIKAICTFYGL